MSILSTIYDVQNEEEYFFLIFLFFCIVPDEGTIYLVK